MLKVQIGKGLEMEVDTSRLNDELRDHVIRTQTIGGPKAPTDPVAMVILRLARKAVISRPEVAAASNADRLATINRLAAEYAKEHDAQLRPRAEKIVALENDQAEPTPVRKHQAMPTRKNRAD